MRMGIGIGWPNNTSGGNSNLRSGWFAINEVCPGIGILAGYTEYVENIDWQTGEYVYSPFLGARALLGVFTDRDPPPFGSQIYTVMGPSYSSCEI